MFQQDLDPVGDSLLLSALCGAIPLAHPVRAARRAAAQGVAGRADLARRRARRRVVLFEMPVGQALLAGTEGAAFGFFPILWIVINAIWVYNLTVASGHFDVLRRSFEKVSPDQRIQAIIIAFCFGALLEALAGFGTPVAITVVMLMALGFQPLKAAAVALIANTAPVAFGALATPIVTLADGLLRRQRRPRPHRRHARLDGRSADPDPRRRRTADPGVRGRRQARASRQTWLPALVCGVAFGLAQFVAANYISVPLADIVAAARRGRVRRAAAAGVAAGRGAHRRRRGRRGRATPARAVRRRVTAPVHRRRLATARRCRRQRRGRGARPTRRTLVIIAIFSIANITAVKEFLAKEPWTYAFEWPGLDVLNAAGDVVPPRRTTSTGCPAAGTLMILAGIITALILKVSPARGAQGLRRDLRRAEVGDHHGDGGARRWPT